MQWLPQTTVLLIAYRDQLFQREAFEPNPATEHLTAILQAYDDNRVKDFNQQVSDYRAYLEEHAPLVDEKQDGVVHLAAMSIGTLDFEAWFNHFEPFYLSLVLYVARVHSGGPGLAGLERPLNRAAFWLIVFTFVVHTFALGLRIYISGRPPVTNLYSSAVFIGWGCVVLGLVLEAIYKLASATWWPRSAAASSLLIATCSRAGGGPPRRYDDRHAGRARHAVLAGHARRSASRWATRRPSWPACSGMLYIVLRRVHAVASTPTIAQGPDAA